MEDSYSGDRENPENFKSPNGLRRGLDYKALALYTRLKSASQKYKT